MTRNCVLANRFPSQTRTVIMAVPDWLGNGRKVAVRSVPVPAKSKLACGSKAGLEELPVTTRRAVGVSESLTLKPTVVRLALSTV